MLKVPKISVSEYDMSNYHGGLIFITFALTQSSVSAAGLTLKYFTRPASPVRLHWHCICKVTHHM